MGAMQWRAQSLPPSLSVDMPHAIFMTGQGGEKGGALEERERPTDRWFPLWSDAQTSNQLSLPRSLTPIDRNVENRIQVFHNGNESSFVEAISFHWTHRKWILGTDLIDVTSKKGLVVVAASFWDGWLVASLCSPKPQQPDISTFDCRCNELIRPLTNWRLRCR